MGAVNSSTSPLPQDLATRLKRDEAGLVAAVVAQHDTGEVLMLGWMDDEALARTMTEGRVTFWSRSRQVYWRKGDTSGHVQHVVSVALDCDGDALLVRVDQTGAACHTGARTCFVELAGVTPGLPVGATAPALGATVVAPGPGAAAPGGPGAAAPGGPGAAAPGGVLA